MHFIVMEFIPEPKLKGRWHMFICPICNKGGFRSVGAVEDHALMNHRDVLPKDASGNVDLRGFKPKPS